MSSYPTALRSESLISPVDNEHDVACVNAERTDAQLVEMVLNGVESAFEEIFDRHKRMVASVASRHFRRAEEIEEIMQITFAKAFQGLANFRGAHDNSLPSWLATIASNACFDTLRKQLRHPEKLSCELSDAETQTLLDLTGPNVQLAEQQIADGDLADKLLTHLSGSDRSLLEMLYVHELSVNEIAERQHCSKANVKVRAWRARAHLRKILRQLL
jgi:RNA polymerase sigma-70 factor (ECF subfamily)